MEVVTTFKNIFLYLGLLLEGFETGRFWGSHTTTFYEIYFHSFCCLIPNEWMFWYPLKGETARRLDCGFCSRSFTRRSALRIHRIAFHSDSTRSFLCPECGSAFKSSSALYEHRKRVHLRYAHNCRWPQNKGKPFLKNFSGQHQARLRYRQLY